MKTKQFFLTITLFFASLTFLYAQDNTYTNVAKNILTKSLNVQKGEVVQILSGIHNYQLAEAFIVEATKMGAVVIPIIYSDNMYKAVYNDIPDKIDGLYDEYIKNSLNNIDVFISLKTTENYDDITKGISKETIEKVGKAWDNQWKVIRASKVRGCRITGPNMKIASFEVKDEQVYNKTYWNAVAVDYKKVSDNARKLESLLKNAKSIEVTSSAGTKISFNANGRTALIYDGVIDEQEAESKKFGDRFKSFPRGSMYMSIDEASAKGKVVVPMDVLNWETKQMLENITFTTKKGKIEKLKAKKGSNELNEYWEKQNDDAKYLSGIQIGLNPAVKVKNQDVDRRHFIAEGMVYLVSGKNSDRGGKLSAEGGLYWFPITFATISIDGKTVIKEGKLMLD